ncbi:hypothetical protein AMTR_s00017p00018990 [Amborella trichopoda]|uniref:Uncharacterized protein n=1 Tax=Amborella trichopoda TaxID=13333 RepID=W1PKG3_AMBTC|nr:hypothetical protein AMTR_s00017p00018990 [Amborella trichopoda]
MPNPPRGELSKPKWNLVSHRKPPKPLLEATTGADGNAAPRKMVTQWKQRRIKHNYSRNLRLDFRRSFILGWTKMRICQLFPRLPQRNRSVSRIFTSSSFATSISSVENDRDVSTASLMYNDQRSTPMARERFDPVTINPLAVMEKGSDDEVVEHDLQLEDQKVVDGI